MRFCIIFLSSYLFSVSEHLVIIENDFHDKQHFQ